VPSVDCGRCRPATLTGGSAGARNRRELATTGYVRKALLGREGSGVRIVTPGGEISVPPADGAPVYGDEGHCYQAFDPLPSFDGNRPVLGAWVVDGEPAGLGIRETTGLITDAGARFLPHVIPG
jgi:glutathionylspermidine synthase